MKSILVLFGSPRKDGNTYFITSHVLKNFPKDTQIKWLQVSSLAISPCTACGHCIGNGICVYNDDMKLVFESVKEADILLVCTPLYFNSVTAQMKTLVDRFQSVYEGKKSNVFKKAWSKKKKAYLICTAGSEKAVVDGARTVIEAFCMAANAQYTGELFINNTDNVSIEGNENILIFTELLFSEF